MSFGQFLEKKLKREILLEKAALKNQDELDRIISSEFQTEELPVELLVSNKKQISITAKDAYNTSTLSKHNIEYPTQKILEIRKCYPLAKENLLTSSTKMIQQNDVLDFLKYDSNKHNQLTNRQSEIQVLLKKSRSREQMKE